VRMPATLPSSDAVEGGHGTGPAESRSDPGSDAGRSLAGAGLLVTAEPGGPTPDPAADAGLASGGIGTPADV
jgi:hypothetical protein